MKNAFCSLLVGVCLLLSVSSVKADDPSPAFAPPTKDPAVVLLLPDGTGKDKISVAVSQALLAEGWGKLGWENNITTAITEASRVDIKVYAVASPIDVKFYVKTSSEKNVAEDRMKKVAVKELRSLEKTIAEKLKLEFHPAKNGTTDSATAE